MSLQSPLIVALDYADVRSAYAVAERLDPNYCRVKVGKELFTAGGPGVVEALQNLGFDCFLDLKFHDIPATVAKSVAAAAHLGVWMVNVHASGGLPMMQEAKAALAKFTVAPKLIAVTVLTSMSQEVFNQTGFSGSIAERVVFLAELAAQAQLDGVVCSAMEARTIKQLGDGHLLTVTPGIRPMGAENQDQSRVLTPNQALEAGSDFLVIGRPITQADDPAQTCFDLYKSLTL